MTITCISPGVWELRSRHGTVIATGDLYTVVKVWAKLRREGWSDLPYRHPRAVGPPTTGECTSPHDCRCSTCNTREPVVKGTARAGTSPQFA